MNWSKITTGFVYKLLVKEFGVVEINEVKNKIIKSKKQKESAELRNLKRRQKFLRKECLRLKNCGDEKGLMMLRTEYRQIRRTITKLLKFDKVKQSAKEEFKEQSKFNADHFRYCKGLVDDSCRAIPDLKAESVELYFKKTYEDERRDMVYTPPVGLTKPKTPDNAFQENAPTKEELRKCLKKKSNGSAPGPSGIPYWVYKKFYCLYEFLFGIFQRVHKQQKFRDPGDGLTWYCW